jgi:hypothetical protein
MALVEGDDREGLSGDGPGCGGLPSALAAIVAAAPDSPSDVRKSRDWMVDDAGCCKPVSAKLIGLIEILAFPVDAMRPLISKQFGRLSNRFVISGTYEGPGS